MSELRERLAKALGNVRPCRLNERVEHYELRLADAVLAALKSDPSGLAVLLKEAQEEYLRATLKPAEGGE
jgi:hypothetical protein